MRIFLSLNQNRVGVKSVLGETVLGEESLYYLTHKKGSKIYSQSIEFEKSDMICDIFLILFKWHQQVKNWSNTSKIHMIS